MLLTFVRGISESRRQRIWNQHKILRFFYTHIDIFEEKNFLGHNSTFWILKMQMRKKLYIFKHFAKSKKLFFANIYHSPSDSYWNSKKSFKLKPPSEPPRLQDGPPWLQGGPPWTQGGPRQLWGGPRQSGVNLHCSNVPVVFMALILNGFEECNIITRGNGRGWALKISGPNGTRFTRHFRAQKSLDFQGPPPSNAPRNDVALLKTITYRAIKTTGILKVIKCLMLIHYVFWKLCIQI